MIDRIIGVLRLDSNTFEEIEHDPKALTEAAIIVVIVALLSGIGSGLGGGGFLRNFLSTSIWALVGWFFWSYIAFWIGTKFFEGEADVNEMLRVLGYAHAPRLLGVLFFIPCVGPLIWLLAQFWSLAAAFVAIRQGLDVDNLSALMTALIGWLVVFVGFMIFGIVFGTLGALLG
jgi:hypothetical protein